MNDDDDVIYILLSVDKKKISIMNICLLSPVHF